MAAIGLSDEIWKSWEKNGKNEFLKTIKHAIKSKKTSNLVQHMYLLINQGVHGVLKKEQAVSTIADVYALHTEIPSLIIDAINIIDGETSANENQTEERSNFYHILKESEKYLSDKLLKERVEIDTLQEAGILKNKSFYTKFIKVKTKLYYKQRKYNLFREESEGFSKLIMELNKEEETNILDIIKSLIGCFNLDPNRVLDVILESFEMRPTHDFFFIPLVRSYMNDSKIICEVLGSKYCFYQSNVETGTPKSLYMITATLLQHEIISLDEIYCWLSPDDKTMQKEVDKEMRDAKEYVRKLNIISTKDKEDVPEEKEVVQDKYFNNQKFGLCEALLNIGDWNNAQQLIKKLPDYYVVDQQPVGVALCKLLHRVIEPVYRKNCMLGPKITGRPVPSHSNKKSPKQATTFLSLRESAIPMMVTLGPALRFDPVLVHKVIMLCKVALESSGVDLQKMRQPDKDSLYYDVLSLLDCTILPTLSFMECNCCVAEEVWNIVKFYPYQFRYCLYSRWKNDTYQQNAKLMRKRGEAQKQIKSIMKRVSKENIKPVGRLIGKLTHCSPGFLLDYILGQVQIYDNLIMPVVDSLKYLTSLSYDVLGCCLVEMLTTADRSRHNHDDGTSISQWLQSLASFCGAIFKKYNIELAGLLQYVANQLKAQKSLDLLILKEIVQKMAGIEAAEEFTDEQLEAMVGGDLLKGEAGYFSQVRNTKKSSLRLKEALADDNLAVTLCLLMAQQKDAVLFKEVENSHIKMVGKLYDQCQDTLVQFGTFLGSTLSVDEYVSKLPSIQSMLQDYHIHISVAFFLARPMFNHFINQKYDQLRKADPNCKKLTVDLKRQKYYEATKEVMAPVVDSVCSLYSPKIWEDISPQFLVTFWSLTMYDLHVPAESYQREINKIKQLALAASDAKDVASSKGKKEQERYNTLIEKLQDEKKKQDEHVAKVMYRLEQEKDTWFLTKSSRSAKNESITQFLQLCLFPRCIFTAVDAAYCAKFVHTIHRLKTINFPTLLCYDRLFCDITYTVTACTENEAHRYGRFLCAVLKTVMHWHSKKSVYDQECANFPGFVTKYRVSNQFTESCDHVGYENYRHVCHKWHYKIAKSTLLCLDSKDYVQIRNGLIILIKIIPYFPILAKLMNIIERKIEKLRDEEKNKRQDLYTLAISYLGQLKQRSGAMIKESDFHIVSEKPSKNHENLEESDGAAKHANGEVKDKERAQGDKTKEPKEAKERTEKKVIRPIEMKTATKNQTQVAQEYDSTKDKERNEKERTSKEKDVEVKEKHSKKEDKREEVDRDREREKRRERKEEKVAQKEERQYREDRYLEMISPKDELRYERGQSERYYGGQERGYYYSGAIDDRDLSSLSSSSNGAGAQHRRSQDPPEADRDVKRRKVEGTSSKTAKHEERKIQQMQMEQAAAAMAASSSDKPEKKERSSRSKEKREKISDEEKELRKEQRKLGRKRERNEEVLAQAEQKRRRDDEKAVKMLLNQNGEMVEILYSGREKHHHTRDKSPYLSGRERSHDRTELREKHSRRTTEGKRR